MRPAYMVNGSNVVVVMDGTQYVASATSHANFDKIVQAIKEERWLDLPELFSIKKAIAKFTEGLVTIVDDDLMYNGAALHNTIATRIMSMHADGYDIKPMARFLNNLMENPSRTAVDELYLFLETGNMPITEDGCFLAYKKVRNDFKDIYTGTFDNSPGVTLEVPRNSVDDNRNNTCSYGLHFCSVNYLSSYGNSSGNKVVIVKINPKDVVAIPSDYQNTKGRTCRYVVLEEFKDYTSKKEYFDKPIYMDGDFTDRGDSVMDNTSSRIDQLNDERDNLADEDYDLMVELDVLEADIHGLEETISCVSETNESLRAAIRAEIVAKQTRVDAIEDRRDEISARTNEIDSELGSFDSMYY